MPVINVAYEINQVVFHVSLTNGVREGVVRSSNVDIKPTSTVIMYNVGYVLPSVSGSGSDALQQDLFADVDTALTEYKARIEAAA
jgi:hypothetical protein